MNVRAAILPVLVLVLGLSGSFPARAQGTIVWTGPVLTFTNLPGSDWTTQPENIDKLTGNVWLTRASKHGLFNALGEGGYTHNVSPAGTEWAIGLLANYASLTYTDWEACYGGQFSLASNIVTQGAVLHLITDDIYIGIQFTFWGGNGGGFTYERTTPLAVPEPGTGGLALVGVGLLLRCTGRQKL
jgi:hypothetical protein